MKNLYNSKINEVFLAQIKRNKKFTKAKFNYVPEEIYNFFFLTFTLLFSLAIISHDPSDPNFFKTGLGDTINNYIGVFGSYISHITFMVLGNSSYFLMGLLLYLALCKYRITRNDIKLFSLKHIALMMIMLISLSLLFEYTTASSGGYLGHSLFYYLSNYIGNYGTLLASILSLIYSAIIYFKISVIALLNKTNKIFTYIYLKTKYNLKSFYEKTNLQIQLNKQKKVKIEHSKEKSPRNTKVEILKEKPIESKREFKEKQQILFSDSNNKLPLIEFLEKHNSEIINHDEASLKLMSEMLEQNLSHYGI